MREHNRNFPILRSASGILSGFWAIFKAHEKARGFMTKGWSCMGSLGKWKKAAVRKLDVAQKESIILISTRYFFPLQLNSFL